MNENEIMVNEENVNNNVSEENENNSNFGIGFVVGGLATLAGIAIGSKIKKAIIKKKNAKNGSSEEEDEIEVSNFKVLNKSEEIVK